MSDFAVESGFAGANLELARIGLDNALTRGLVTATSAAAGRPVGNLLLRDTYQSWRPTAVSTVIEAELDAPEPLDYLAIARHDMGTKGVTAELELKPVGGAWTKVLDLTPGHDGPILVPFTATTAEAVRLTFGDEGIPTIAVLAIGKAVVMERPLRASMQPVWLNRQTRVTSQLSDTGELLGSIVVSAGSAGSPEWQQLSRAFYENTLKPLAAGLPGCGFFFAWQPLEHPGEVLYGAIDGDVRGEHIARSARYTFGFSMRGIGSPSTPKPFTPGDLFASGEAGAWYEPGRRPAGTLRQTEGGAVVAPGDPVGWVQGQLPGGVPATAAGSERPLLGRTVKRGRVNQLDNTVFAGAVAGVIGSGGAAPTGTTLSSPTNGISIEVVGSGVEDGEPYIDLRWFGTASANAFGIFSLNPTIPGTVEETWTNSASVRIAPGSGPFTPTTGTTLRLEIGEHSSGGASLINSTLSITPTGTYQRFQLARTLTNGSIATVRPFIVLRVSNGDTVDVTYRITAPQFELGAAATAYQRVAGAHDVSEAGERSLWYLAHDQVDDELSAELPDLGTAATIASFDEGGLTVLAGQTIEGATALPAPERLTGVVFIDRALTIAEQARLAAYWAARAEDSA